VQVPGCFNLVFENSRVYGGVGFKDCSVAVFLNKSPT